MRPDRELISWPGWFSLEIPSSWEIDDDPESATITLSRNRDGVGAVTISLARRNRPGKATLDEAAELSRAEIAGRRYSTVWDMATMVIAGSPASTFKALEMREDEHTYWEVWHIIADDRMAYITYNCDPDDAAQEAHDREIIVHSLKWENEPE